MRRAITAAAIGNFITWFDFAAYGFLAVILGQIFFPSENPATSLLATFAAFGVAFLMNPIGGFVFGRLGDKVGRKKILATSIILMSASTFAVGLLPGYASIGLAAPVLLVALRIIQGFAAGGEPGGAATYLVESAARGRRARTVSFWHCSSYLANAAASILVLGLYALLGEAAMFDWGWRIPFLIAGPLGLVGLYLRLKLSDTAEFERLQESGEVSETPIKDVFATSRRQVIQVIGCIAFQAAAFYFIFVYMQTYLQSEVGFSFGMASTSTVTCDLDLRVRPVVGSLRPQARHHRRGHCQHRDRLSRVRGVRHRQRATGRDRTRRNGNLPGDVHVGLRGRVGRDLPQPSALRRILDRLQRLGSAVRRHRPVHLHLADLLDRKPTVPVDHPDRDGTDGNHLGGDAARDGRARRGRARRRGPGQTRSDPRRGVKPDGETGALTAGSQAPVRLVRQLPIAVAVSLQAQPGVTGQVSDSVYPVGKGSAGSRPTWLISVM
jgi:MFS family permease